MPVTGGNVGDFRGIGLGRLPIALLLFSVVPCAISISTNLTTLQLVQIISRHGDRAPILPYPNDLYKNATVYTLNGWGELTEIGARQVYDLGSYLRQRYDGYLSRKYRKRDFYMLSSDIDRAIMSAEAMLAGLYALGPVPRSRDIFKEWQPVPIHTIPEVDDNIINGKMSCTRYEALYQEFLESDQVVNFVEGDKEFVEFVADKSGLTSIRQHFQDIFQVQDALRCQRLHNLTLPTWVNSTVYDRLQYFKSVSFTWGVATDEMKMLKAGPLFARLLEEMQAKVEAEAATLAFDEMPAYEEPKAFRKMYIYSGHDSTISRMLQTLNLFQLHVPPYAAALLIELHKEPNTEEFFIELYYRNETGREPYNLDLGSTCGIPCTFQRFSALVQKYIPSDWKDECMLQTQLMSGQNPPRDGPRGPLTSVSFEGSIPSYQNGNKVGAMNIPPLGITAPGLMGFVLAVIAVTSLLVSTILLSSFLRDRHARTQHPLSSYHHLG